MKTIENAFRFLFKNYLIAIPLFVALVIPAMVQQTASRGLMGPIWDMIRTGMVNPEALASDPMALANMITSVAAVSGAVGFLSFILNFIAQPTTAGLVNKGLSTGHADLRDFSQALSENIVKYIMYWLGTIVFGIIAGIIAIIILLIFGFLATALGGFGIFLFVIVMIAMALAGIGLSILLTMWFPAMVVDGIGVVDGLKQSIQVAKKYFWNILGITLLVNIAGGIVGAIFGFLNRIPVIGAVILTIIPTATGIVLTIFYFIIYRKDVGKATLISTDQTVVH